MSTKYTGSYVSFITQEIPSLIQILTLPTALSILFRNEITHAILIAATGFISGFYLKEKEVLFFANSHKKPPFYLPLFVGIIQAIIVAIISMSILSSSIFFLQSGQ